LYKQKVEFERRTMMKKFLVLALVLSVASLANAGLSLTINPAGTQITLSSDTGLIGGIDMGLGLIGNVTLGDITMRTAGAPVAAPIIFDYTYADLGGAEGGLPWVGGLKTIKWGDPDPINAAPAGVWFTIAVSGIGTVDLTDGNGGALGQTLAVTPEPMTMLLLGLGGLFLRRK
jgi:hypothetical protein